MDVPHVHAVGRGRRNAATWTGLAWQPLFVPICVCQLYQSPFNFVLFPAGSRITDKNVVLGHLGGTSGGMPCGSLDRKSPYINITSGFPRLSCNAGAHASDRHGAGPPEGGAGAVISV